MDAAVTTAAKRRRLVDAAVTISANRRRLVDAAETTSGTGAAWWMLL